MNAVEALSQARDTNCFARPKDKTKCLPIGYLQVLGGFVFIGKRDDGVIFRIGLFESIDIVALVNLDGSPVEWEVITEEEL